MASCMRRTALLLSAYALAFGLACNAPAHALDAKSQATLDELDKFLKEDIANTRNLCASGKAPEWVATKRARYGNSERFPDASQMCVAILEAQARDGHLSDLYREVLKKAGGDIVHYDQWPRVIGGTVLSDKTEVEIGNYKTAHMTPALVFDAGFTVAYQEGKSGKSGTASAAATKTLAESCLAQRGSVSKCFSAGYIYGANAFDGRIALTDD